MPPQTESPIVNKSRLVFFIVSICIVVPLLGSGLVFGAAADDAEGDSIYKYLSIFREVLKLVREAYVEQPDIRTLWSGALDGASDALDPLSVYVPAGQVAEYDVARRVGRSRSGLMLLKDRGVAYVVTVDDGSPAETAGVRPGDIVSELDGVSSRSMPLWQIRQTLAGEAGTEVLLELVRGGDAEELTLTLADFEPPKPSLTEVQGVSVLRLSAIDSGTTAAVKELLPRTGALLLDLRGVAGENGEAAFDVAELFTQGELGSLKARSKTLETYASKQAPLWSGSLGVIMDHGTQGASEVLAAVLKQRADASLVGDRSFGHAGQSERVRLSDGVLELTSSFYAGPDGEILNESLVPDIRVDRPRRGGDDEEGDAYLERAVELFLQGESDTEDRKAA